MNFQFVLMYRNWSVKVRTSVRHKEGLIFLKVRINSRGIQTIPFQGLLCKEYFYCFEDLKEKGQVRLYRCSINIRFIKCSPKYISSTRNRLKSSIYIRGINLKKPFQRIFCSYKSLFSITFQGKAFT